MLWGEVAAAAAGHGLAGLAGSSTVGVVGYSIGGGVGWLARRYGLAANSILAADVVTADGRIVRTDREHEPTAAAGKETAFCYLANRPSLGRLTKKVAMDLVSCPLLGAQNARFWMVVDMPVPESTAVQIRRLRARPGGCLTPRYRHGEGASGCMIIRAGLVPAMPAHAAMRYVGIIESPAGRGLL